MAHAACRRAVARFKGGYCKRATESDIGLPCVRRFTVYTFSNTHDTRVKVSPRSSPFQQRVKLRQSSRPQTLLGQSAQRFETRPSSP
jgi:hypothetical protein